MKVESIRNFIIDKVLKDVIDTLTSLREDYLIPVSISKCELRIILNEFYNYYEKKQIQYHYIEMMTGHFEDIAISAIESNSIVDSSFILNQLQLFELLDSPVEVNPKETKKLVNSISKKIERRPRLV